MKKLWLGLLCLVLILGLLPVTPVEAAAFEAGDTVNVVSNVHVRTDAGTSNDEIDDPDYNYKGVTLIGMLGTILDEPKDADGYTWWKVNFGPDLYEGWCIEGGLQKTSAPPTPMVRGIDVSHHQGTIIWEDVYNVGIRFAYVQAKQGAENVITQIPGGTEGTVVLGGAKTKQNGTTYTWWQVLFDSFEQGWVAHTQIERLDGGGIDTLEPGMDVRTIGETNLRSSPEIAAEAAYPEWYEDNMRAIAEMKYTPIAPQSRDFYYGSYFFARPCLNLEGNELENEAREEARSFINEAESYLKSGYMQPMLDLEDATLAHPEWGVHYWDDDGTPVVGTLSTIAAKLDAKLGEGTTKERLSQWVLAWIDEVEEWGSENGLVIKPVIYLHPSWLCYFNNTFNNTLCEKIKENGIWPANVSQAAVNNRNPYEGNTACGNAVENQWDIWQYAHDGWIEGITGDVDLDYYNGTLENLRSDLLIGNGIDVFMLVDLTGSFYNDLPVFKAQAPDLIDTLKSSYPDIRFGLGKFEDYPISPFGSASYGDKAYERLVDLTSDADAVLSIIAGLYTRYGMDGPESQLVALYQAATGAGQDLSGVGYPGASIPPGQQANFRDGATKLFLLWTDAPFHNPGDPGNIPYPGPSFDETVDAILALDPPMVIGISSGGGGLADLEAIAAATGALAPSGGIDTDGDGIVDIPEGEPLVATIGYSGQGIAAAIESLVEAAAILPVADAGGPYTGEVGETIVFDGSGSFGLDGSIVLYEWDFESDGVFDFSSAEPTAEYAYPAEFSGVVTLRVTDNDGNAGTDTSPVEILLPPNVAPVADAGPDQVVERTITAGAEVTLNGSGSYDPDGDPLTYGWTWAGGFGWGGVTPTVTMPMGTTTVTLEVSDGALSDTDTVDITVRDTTPPLVTVEFPTAGLALQDGAMLAATASDISGVAAVYFYVREPGCPQGQVISTEFEDLLATLNGATGEWEYNFDTLSLPDGNYIVLAKGVDTYDNEGWSTCVPFSIRNWAVIELLPASQNNKAKRSMPVKFSLRVATSVDPGQPFVWNDELTIKIYATNNPGNILQTSTFGDTARDYRIDSPGELYITNFKTSRVPMPYMVEIWRTSKNFMVGSFTFETVK